MAILHMAFSYVEGTQSPLEALLYLKDGSSITPGHTCTSPCVVTGGSGTVSPEWTVNSCVRRPPTNCIPNQITHVENTHV
jgi:hypothetical protein